MTRSITLNSPVEVLQVSRNKLKDTTGPLWQAHAALRSQYVSNLSEMSQPYTFLILKIQQADSTAGRPHFRQRLARCATVRNHAGLELNHAATWMPLRRDYPKAKQLFHQPFECGLVYMYKHICLQTLSKNNLIQAYAAFEGSAEKSVLLSVFIL